MDSLPEEIHDKILVLAPVLRQTCRGLLGAARRLIVEIAAKHTREYLVESNARTRHVEYVIGRKAYIPEYLCEPIGNGTDGVVCLYSISIADNLLEIEKLDLAAEVRYNLCTHMSWFDSTRIKSSPNLQEDLRELLLDEETFDLTIYNCRTQAVFSYEFKAGGALVVSEPCVEILGGLVKLPAAAIAAGKLLRRDQVIEWLCVGGRSPGVVPTR
jgi:hypothetical protein